MKTHLPQHPKEHKRHSGTGKTDTAQAWANLFRVGLFFSASLCLCGSVFAVQPPAEPLTGRLFYTPAQRVMLVNARVRKVTEIAETQKPYTPPESAPISFDGVITRSDGVATHWVNGRTLIGQPTANVRSLKPGQTRAYQKVYEPYQLLRPGDAPKTSGTTVPPAAHNEAAP